MKHILLLSIVLFGSFLSAKSLNADEPISVSVRPAVAVARGNAQLHVFVERNDANRSLTWEVDGPSYYRRSTTQLDGVAAPKSWLFSVRDLPEGEFDVRATVTRSNNSQSVAISKIVVIGGFRN